MQLWAWGLCCWDGTVIFQTNRNSSLVALEFYCCLRRWPLEANPLNNARRCLCPRIVRRCGAALTLGLQVLLSGILRIYRETARLDTVEAAALRSRRSSQRHHESTLRRHL